MSPSWGWSSAGARGVQAYALPSRAEEREQTGEDRLAKLLHDLPVELKPAGLLLVVRTVPGSAHAIAASLDRCRWTEVVGSIAGDDTLFLAFAGPGRPAAGPAATGAPRRLLSHAAPWRCASASRVTTGAGRSGAPV